ncbi:MAG: hypothetical protein HY036_06460 [Nitrospirae bacterium]|nr:hypothetical protein [Nitrospirota bacterium]MBI3352203.1 hypothetical protein [Nitrospirota bacterium]
MKIFFKILFLWFLLVPFSKSGFAHDLMDLEEENHGRYEGNDRDEILAREMNLDQTSPESLGYKDFESYGRWILNDDYGKVWLPNVDEHWVPFRYGHWIWNPFYGWVWASTEVWGWRPFHYGRWVWLDLEGWAWMPGPPVEVWTPGVVRWIWQSNQVGWAPLAPGEAYIPLDERQRVYTLPFNARRVPRSVTFIRRDRFFRNIDSKTFIPVRPPPIRRVRPDHEQRRFFPNPQNVPVRPVPPPAHGRIIQPPTIPQEGTNNNPAPGRRRLIR